MNKFMFLVLTYRPVPLQNSFCDIHTSYINNRASFRFFNWIWLTEDSEIMVVNIQFTLILLPSWMKFWSVTISRSFEILLLQSKNNHRWGCLVCSWLSDYLTLHWLHSDKCKDSCKLWITAVLLNSEVQNLLKDWGNHRRPKSW